MKYLDTENFSYKLTLLAGNTNSRRKANMNHPEKNVLAFQAAWTQGKKALEQLQRFHKGESFVLIYLYLKKTETLPSDISRALDSSTARISSILKALEKKGEINRDIDKSNRNNVIVTLTDEGRKKAASLRGGLSQTLTKAFAEMGEEDSTEFVRLTNTFLTLVEKHLPMMESEQ
jgi:DNA-binding MarR family transcriptional regulator